MGKHSNRVSLPREYWGKITCLQRLRAILPTTHFPSRCMWSCVLPYALVSHQSTILLQHSLPCVDPCAWLPHLNDAYISLCLLPFLVALASVKHLFGFCTCFFSPLFSVSGFLLHSWCRHTAQTLWISIVVCFYIIQKGYWLYLKNNENCVSPQAQARSR